MSRHTEGPWEARRCPANRRRWLVSTYNGGYSDPKTTIARTTNWLSTDSEQEEQANAQLIAAAPDLLVACREALNAATVKLDTYAASEAKQKEVVALIEDAIAKATE